MLALHYPVVKINSVSTSSWNSLIDPYRYKLSLTVSNVDNIVHHCNRIYAKVNTPIYTIVILSIIFHYVNEKKMCLKDAVIKVENICCIPVKRLKQMYSSTCKNF